MDWIDYAWPLMAGISATLGLVHLCGWSRRRSQPAMLAFALLAAEMAALAILELQSMQATTPAAYSAVLQGAEWVVALVPFTIVAFVRLHFGAGRAWLGWTASALRAACLFESVLTGTDTRFLDVTALRQVELLGVLVSAPVGPTKPSMWAMELADALLILFLASAIMDVWRRTTDPYERQRVALVCGSAIAFVGLGTAAATAMSLGLIGFPLVVALPFLIVVLVMAHDLGGEVVRATLLEAQLRENESRLRGTEQRLQLTAEAVGLCLWTWDLRSDVKWFSETGGALFGLPTGGRMEHAALLARVHPDDRARILRARDEALLGEGRFECEYRLRVDGGTRWIVETGRIEHAPSGVGGAMMRGVLIDITERHEAEERFRLVVEHSPYAKLMVDAQGTIALANPQAAALFGYPREELVGHGIDMLVPDRVRAAHPQRRKAYLQHPKPRSMGHDREILARRRDGSEIPVEISLMPVHMGDVQYVLTTVTDISERLRNEQEIATQRDELAHLSRISLLGEMSASLAHELNQPLTAVLSNAQAALRFLDREPPDLAEVRESLLHIVENDKRAGEVIRRLRAMLRKEHSEHRPLQLNEVVHEVMRLVNSDLLNRNVQARLELAVDLPLVLGDRVQLQQVLLNLVVNACDAMAAQPGERHVTIGTGVAADGQVRLNVSDVGPGIPATDLERIFTPFVTTKAHGMGLGLAVCRTILQAHQGTLRATNGPDRGATMVVLLPRLEGRGG